MAGVGNEILEPDVTNQCCTQNETPAASDAPPCSNSGVCHCFRVDQQDAELFVQNLTRELHVPTGLASLDE